MTIETCLPGLIESGAVDKDQADQVRTLYGELEQTFRRQFGDQAAGAMASDQTIAILKGEAKQRRRQALLQVQAQQGIRANMARHVNAGGRLDHAALAHFDLDVRVKGISNVEARRRAILGQAHGKMTEILETFHKDVLGRVRSPALLANVVREAFGVNTGDDAARELAKSWAHTAEWLRTKFNAAGGSIGKRDDWGLPQAHDNLKVRQASFDEWRDFIAPKLDVAKMVDQQTGLAFTPARLELALKAVYESIRTDGWSTRKAGGLAGSKLANRRADPRFLVFKGADDWLAYNEKFGAADPFSAMMGYLDGMSRDIASMQILGPNPTATVKWLGDIVEQTAHVKADDSLINRAKVARYQMQTMWSAFTGELNRPVNATMARGFGAFRALQSAAKLGGAVLSALTDVGFQKVTARYNGLPYTGILAGYLKHMNPFDAGDRRLAVRSGLIAEEWGSRAGAMHRYNEEFNAPELARRLNDGVLRVSGLSAWTQSGRWAFGMEFMGAIADAAEHGFAQLDPSLREAMERYGIGQDGWDVIRSTPQFDHRGSKFIRPDELADRGDIPASLADTLATRMLEMIQTESRFAVPDATLRTKAALTGNARPGTVVGEGMRTLLQFKAFPATIISTHLARAAMAPGAMGRSRYLAELLIATTVMGAVALQLKQIASSKDPRPMATPAFWAAATAQGGGVGIFGDFLFSDQNRFGGGLMNTLAGPGLGTIDDARHLTLGNIQAAIQGKDTHVGQQLTRFIGANTPGASLWWTRAAFQHLVLDQMQSAIDPDHREHWKRMEARAHKDYDQEYWWRPGEVAPDHAPDLSAAFGGNEE